MKYYSRIAAGCIIMFAASACEYQKQYECKIIDPATGEVIKKVKVNYESECNAFLLGM